MRAQLLAIRSIGAEFANRVFYPVLITSIVIVVACISLTSGLATTNQWWLLLYIPTVIAACASIGVLVIAKLIIRTVTPVQSIVQKKATKKFVDKLQRLSEITQTPKYILLFQIIRDIAAPRENGFIGSFAGDTASLKGEYTELINLFRQKRHAPTAAK